MESNTKVAPEMSEYSALRAEIISKQEKKMEVQLHMYVLYGTLLTLGIETSNRYFLLLTYLIIIPYQVMINNCEWNVSRISTYISIFYEEDNPAMKWESFNKYYPKYTDYLHKETAGLIGFIRQAGSIHLALLATGFYVYKTLEIKRQEPFGVIDWVIILLSIFMIFVTIYINRSSNTTVDKELVEIMQEFKKEDQIFKWSEKAPGRFKQTLDYLKYKLKI